MATTITEAEYEAAVAFADQLRLLVKEGTTGAKVLPALLLPEGAYPDDPDHVSNQMLQRIALAVVKTMRAVEPPPSIGAAALGELMRFAAADHSHGLPAPGSTLAADYASASNAWKDFPTAGLSGFKKPPASFWIDQLGYTCCAGAVQRVSLAAPTASEHILRLPDSAMWPTNNGERAFKCACWGGSITVHVTGPDYGSGAGYLRIFDWTGTPENAVSLDCIRFRP